MGDYREIDFKEVIKDERRRKNRTDRREKKIGQKTLD